MSPLSACCQVGGSSSEAICICLRVLATALFRWLIKKRCISFLFHACITRPIAFLSRPDRHYRPDTHYAAVSRGITGRTMSKIRPRSPRLRSISPSRLLSRRYSRVGRKEIFGKSQQPKRNILNEGLVGDLIAEASDIDCIDDASTLRS